MKAKRLKPGRKSVMTPEVILKIEQVAALDGSVEEMGLYAGVSYVTIYDYMKKNEAFAKRIAELRNTPVLKARQTIVRALQDPAYAFKYVEKKRRKEFGNAIDITSDGKQLGTPVLGALATEEQKQALPHGILADIGHQESSGT